MTNTIGQNITLIRKSKGLSQKETAEKSGISRQALHALETGAVDPKSSTLISVANTLGVKISDFFAPIRMAESVRFRISNTNNKKDNDTRNYEIIKITNWLEQYNYLERNLGFEFEYDFLNIASSHPREAAKEIRKQLKLDQDEPINDIVSLLEHHGIKIYSHSPNLYKYFGMSIGLSSGGPLIAINTNAEIPTERKIFTFAHEFGHLILHKNSYKKNSIEDVNEEENSANIFASYFLMPEKAFTKKFDESKGLFWVDRILHIKRIFKVSYKTVIKRLIDLGIKDPDIYLKFNKDYKNRYNHDLKNHYEPFPIDKSEFNIDLIPDRFNNLVRMAYEKEIITASKAAELLDMNMVEFENLKNSWSYIEIKR